MLKRENVVTFLFLAISLLYAENLIRWRLRYVQYQGYHIFTLYYDC